MAHYTRKVTRKMEKRGNMQALIRSEKDLEKEYLLLRGVIMQNAGFKRYLLVLGEHV